MAANLELSYWSSEDHNIHDLFCSFATELLYHLNEEIVISRLVTSAYILSSLTTSLQHHIEYCCKTKKYGTLFYRPNTDLKPALAQSLWQLRQKTKNESDPTSTNPTTESVEEQLDQVELLNDLNSLACAHINSYTPRHSKEEFNFAEFNIDQQIGEIDPKLWEAICLLTRSASERKGVSKVTEPTSASFHTKKCGDLLSSA